MPDKSNEESIESDVEQMSSPVISSISQKKLVEIETQEEGSYNRYLFISLAIAFAIGSSHSMSFGASLFHHGGILFFQFFTALIFIGYPLLLLETSLAQFSSSGSFLQFRRATPLFGGIVSTMTFVLILRLTIQSINLTNMGFLTGNSLTGMAADLPWANCDSLPKDCFDHHLIVKCPLDDSNLTQCAQQYLSLVDSRTSSDRKTPFVSFVETNVLKNALFLDDFHGSNWISVWICFILFWILIALSVYWMEKWLKYLAICVVSLSFLYYLVHLIVAGCLEGAVDGFRFLWTPKWKTLYNGEAWTAAFLHSVLALNLANGGMAFLSKKRPFNAGFRRDGILISGLIGLFYILVNLTTFFYTGHLAKLAFSDAPKELKFLLKNRLHFLHFVYIESISSFKFGWLWSFLHFLVEILRNYLFIIIIISALIDMYKEKRAFLQKDFDRILPISFLTGIGAVVSAPFLLPGGTLYLTNLEYFTDILTVSIAFFQVIAFSLYGVDRLAVNLETMSKSWRFMKHFYSFCWSLVCPAALLSSILIAIITAVIAPKPIHFAISTVGWTIVILGWIFPYYYVGIRLFEARRRKEHWRILRKPESEWGPISEENQEKSVRDERAARVR